LAEIINLSGPIATLSGWKVRAIPLGFCPVCIVIVPSAFCCRCHYCLLSCCCRFFVTLELLKLLLPFSQPL